MIPNIGPLEIGIVLIIALVVFGPKRLPELGSGIGRGLREFKQSISGDEKVETPALPRDSSTVDGAPRVVAKDDSAV